MPDATKAAPGTAFLPQTGQRTPKELHARIRAERGHSPGTGMGTTELARGKLFEFMSSQITTKE